MKSKVILGIGVIGLVFSIAGGYYYWLGLRIAAMIPGIGDGSLKRQVWLWFITFLIGFTLLLTSGILFIVSRRHKSRLSAP
ncbi:MAG: hypothetical protein ABSH48_01815 [Verrucomicrobiota bacterium]